MENLKTNDFSKHRILIAEDDDFSYLFLENILKKLGIELHRTRSGEETLEYVKNNPNISLILMDIKMPGMNGLTASTEIRKLNISIPIIAQTAYALTGDKETAIEAGCDDYISKPINRNELLALMQKYLKI